MIRKPDAVLSKVLGHFVDIIPSTARTCIEVSPKPTDIWLVLKGEAYAVASEKAPKPWKVYLYAYIYVYICYPPPRDLPFQNVLVPPQGYMTIRFSLRWSANLHNYMPPKTCTFATALLPPSTGKVGGSLPSKLSIAMCSINEMTSLVAERFVVIQDCFLEYSSSCYIVSIEVFFLNKINTYALWPNSSHKIHPFQKSP